MRKDMSKIIVERPRTGGHNARKGRQLSDEFLPKNEGMKRPYGYEHKELNENLAPLRRFLLKQAGRPWNDVYSEISENINPSNIVQQHVLQHIKDYVITNVQKGEDGRLYEIRKYWGGGPRLVEESYALLYVHPDSGLLIKNPGMPYGNTKHIPGTRAYEQEQERHKRPVIFYVCDDGTELHRIEGIWYKFTLDVVPLADERYILAEDGITPVLVKTVKYATDTLNGLRKKSGETYRNKKIQLNSNELKKYQLTNEIK